MRACLVCSGDISPGSRGPVATYCSARCRNRAKALRDGRTLWVLSERACSHCGSQFTARRSSDRYCSRSHLREAGLLKGRERSKARANNPVGTVTVKACEDCGILVVGIAGRNGVGRRRVCPQCRRDRQNRRVVVRSRRTGRTVAEKVTIQYLLERDDARCQLCTERVRPDRRWPDPLSPSIDHVVPLSLGGEHTRSNTQLAHLRCNQSKNNRPSQEQLRLVG